MAAAFTALSLIHTAEETINCVFSIVLRLAKGTNGHEAPEFTNAAYANACVNNENNHALLPYKVGQ